MAQYSSSLKSAAPVLIILLIALFTSSCAPAATPATTTPIVQTVEVTRVVTSEVTRLVDVPVTNTPTPTLAQTSTPTLTPTRIRIPSPTPTWEPPQVEILEHSSCMYGPGMAYLYKYGLNANLWMQAIGRNEDGSWLVVKAPNDADSNACWVETAQVNFLSGDIKDLPVSWIALPYSALYLPPTGGKAERAGDEVTISWQPVRMTEDDYRGYLVEAWVCQGGKQVFQPLGYYTSYNQNQEAIADNDPIAVTVIDEPGCDVPSRARLYSVEKHGYTNYVMVPWPGFTTSATSTATP